MENQEWNDALYSKMTNEQSAFKKQLLSQSAEQILLHAYEYAMREDILFSFDFRDLTPEQAEALCQSETPLAEIFKAFENKETDHMEDIWSSIEQRANEMIAQQCAAVYGPQRSVALYLHDSNYAHANGEIEQYRSSFQANVACRDAIDAGIREHYHDNRLGKEAVSQVVDQFGMDRVLHVLAATVRYKSWDERFSHDQKTWAHGMPDPDSSDRAAHYVVHQSHSGLVNLFLQQARKMQQEQQRPSVREQLQQKAIVPDKKAPARKEPER